MTIGYGCFRNLNLERYLQQCGVGMLHACISDGGKNTAGVTAAGQDKR